MDDYHNGFKYLYSQREAMKNTKLSQVGRELRARMPFVADDDKYSTPEA